MEAVNCDAAALDYNVAVSWKGALLRRLPPAVAEPLRDAVLDHRDRRAWEAYRSAPSIPPPHIVKVKTVLDAARDHGIDVLIETGTFEGEMVRKCRKAFRRIFTIELDPALAARARRRFAKDAGVTVLQGDSAERLPEVLRQLDGPAVLWLDGHYSGGITALGSKETPLLEELGALARHGRRDHVILIDDARMLGSGDYPTLERLREALRAIHPEYRIEVRDDIVRATPPKPRRAA